MTDILERLRAKECPGTTNEWIREAADEIEALRQSYEIWRADKNAYAQRNFVVAALARCFPSGVRPTDIQGWEADWHGCVYIDLPTGQISYHYSDAEAWLFEDLPRYEKPYDGHDTKCVHARLALLVNARKDEGPEPE